MTDVILLFVKAGFRDILYGLIYGEVSISKSCFKDGEYRMDKNA